MSEPFLERMSRFTPDAGSVNRDALLFATGRASARPNRGWIALAGALAATQVLSLALLWPHSTLPGAGSPVQFANAPSADPEPPPLPNPGMLVARHTLESEPDDRPDTGTFVDTGPPLRAFGSPPLSILN
jgi:hypothetical protein